MVLGTVKSKLPNPKRCIGSKSNNRKEKEVLQLVDEVVLGVMAGVMAKVRAKTGTKDLITIIVKDTDITIVPMVVIETIVAVITLGVTMGAMDMDRDVQTTVSNRALMASCLREWQSPKELSAVLTEGTGERRRLLK